MGTMGRVRPIFQFIMLTQIFGCILAWGGGDKVRLNDIKVLTLKHGQMTTGRRSSPVPQLQCLGGSAKCEFTPRVVQCYNKGSDGSDIQWECKTDMDNAYRFGDISVTCEGYDYPDDPYVLKGSCGLEYTIDLTKEGMHNARYAQEHNYYGGSGGGGGGGPEYGWNQNLFKQGQKKSNFITNLACLAVVAVIVFAIYKTCISPVDETRQRSSTNDDYHGRGPGSSPPPPGFRSDYYSGSSGTDHGYSGGSYGDSCGANTNRTGSSGFGRNAGGFWTGAAAGGLLGYMFGNRNNDATYGGATYRARPSTSGFSSGYSSGGSWGGFSSGSSSSSSSGTRTASGFGGTSRR